MNSCFPASVVDVHRAAATVVGADAERAVLEQAASNATASTARIPRMRRFFTLQCLPEFDRVAVAIGLCRSQVGGVGVARPDFGCRCAADEDLDRVTGIAIPAHSQRDLELCTLIER